VYKPEEDWPRALFTGCSVNFSFLPGDLSDHVLVHLGYEWCSPGKSLLRAPESLGMEDEAAALAKKNSPYQQVMRGCLSLCPRASSPLTPLSWVS